MISSKYRKTQLKQLCSIVGCEAEELLFILDHVEEYYKEWFEEKTNKQTGELKRYKDGTIKTRVIRPSLKKLKVIHSKIKSRILAPIPLPANVHGGVRRKSNITNAKPHQGNKFQLTTDLQDFYPSIDHRKVYDTFLSLGFSHHFSHWLTKLTTWKSSVPQGAPTSSHVANLVFLKTDYQLINLCVEHGITYTRYVDDLTFSSQKDFKPLVQEILKMIQDSGFKVNYRKTMYKGFQSITGIEVFNNFIAAPKKIKDKAQLEKLNGNPAGPYSSYLIRIEKTNVRRYQKLNDRRNQKSATV